MHTRGMTCRMEGYRCSGRRLDAGQELWPLEEAYESQEQHHRTSPFGRQKMPGKVFEGLLFLAERELSVNKFCLGVACRALSSAFPMPPHHGKTLDKTPPPRYGGNCPMGPRSRLWSQTGGTPMRVLRSSPLPPSLFKTCLRVRPSFLVRPQILTRA